MTVLFHIFPARIGGLLLLIVLALAPAARAAAPSPPVTATASETPLFADSVSFHGFSRYWTGFVKNADRVVLVVAIIAIAALFIITRGKWL